jgi:hypothetical protein
MSTKLKAALTAALLFFVVSSPMLYKVVDKVVGSVVGAVSPGLLHVLRVAEGGCPTTYGLALHSTVFGLVVYFLMKA